MDRIAWGCTAWVALHGLHCMDCTAWVALHGATLHRLHCMGLHCMALHCMGLHCMGLHCMGLHCMGLHCMGLHCMGMHCMGLCTAWGYTEWVALIVYKLYQGSYYFELTKSYHKKLSLFMTILAKTKFMTFYDYFS